MENKNSQAHTDSDMDRVLNQFSENERSEIKKVWDISKDVPRQISTSSEDEVEEALQNVHLRIDDKERSSKKAPNITRLFLSNARYLVAAMALIVIGLGIFMVPKTITVPYAETAMIELPDGSTVELNSGSTLQYSRFFAFTGRNVTLNGEAYFSVESGEKPFVVQANGSAIEVTGTEFNVRSWSSDPSNETTVTVTHGNVEFYPQGQKVKRVSLKAGESSRLNLKMISPSQPTLTSTDEALAWREQRLVFQETPLIVILHDLERSFDVNIELDVEDMEYETLTAYYNRPANIETILEDICTVKGLRYTKNTNGYRIFK